MKLIFTLYFVCLFGFTYAQNQPAKSKKPVKSVVQHRPSFPVKIINGHTHLKSATAKASPYQSINQATFHMPDQHSDSLKSMHLTKPVSSLKSAKALTPKEQSYEFLENVSAELNITNPREAFIAISSVDDELGHRHVRFNQKYKDIKVYNSYFYVQISDKQ
jgi:Zn-dependent metalloprotease